MSTAIQSDDNHANDKMLNIDEAAEFLRVPVATMRYRRCSGDGPFSFKVGRHAPTSARRDHQAPRCRYDLTRDWGSFGADP